MESVARNPPCFLHSDTECGLCYSDSSKKKVRRGRPERLPRRTLAKTSALSIEERVNLKVLAPILSSDELKRYPEALQSLTEEELDYLIENRL